MNKTLISTLKLRIKNSSTSFLEFMSRQQKEFTNAVFYSYNRLYKDNLSETEIKHKLAELNNITTLDSWFNQCVVKEANVLLKKRESLPEPKRKKYESKHHFEKRLKEFKHNKFKPIKGSRKALLDRTKGKISHEEYVKQRDWKVVSQGETYHYGNRKFRLYKEGVDDKVFYYIKYQSSRSNVFYLQVEPLNFSDTKYLDKLIELQNASLIPITYKIDQYEICISFDMMKLKIEPEIFFKPVENRWLGIDLNPNYIGISVVQWKSSTEYDVLFTEVISFKEINDNYNVLIKEGKLVDKNDIKPWSIIEQEKKYWNAKRKHEMKQVTAWLPKIAKHFRCQGISCEMLDMSSKDLKKGKALNRLCMNQFLRTAFKEGIRKQCYIQGVKLQEVKPEYSSTAGNIMFRHLNQPDMINASIEISRRAYEFDNQFIRKIKPEQKNIVKPDVKSFNGFWISLEELKLEKLKDEDIKLIHDAIYRNKNSELKKFDQEMLDRIESSTRLRVPLDDKRVRKKVFRLFSQKSCLKSFCCIE